METNMLSLLLNGNFTFEALIADVLAVLLIIFLVLPFHEWAHAQTAYLLGDKGIKARGRLSFNPLRHIDPIGALLMILIGFGWARPVPVDSRYFKNPKVGMAITALMGPVANLVAAIAGLIVCWGVIYIAPYNFLESAFCDFLFQFFSFYIIVNINLAVFNLIPIPPLDGSKILFAFLPDRAVEFFYKYQMAFFVVLFILISYGPLSGVLSTISDVIFGLLSALIELPFKLIFG